MDFLDRFKGTYDTRLVELATQRNELVEQLRGFVPANYIELLEAREDGEVDHELDWVKVPDPRSDDPTTVLEVLPTIGLWRGENEDESDTPIAPGLAGMMLIGKLPTGEEALIGNISVLGGNYTPTLWINKASANPHATQYTEWQTTDAELFLKLVKSALDAQDAPH